MGGQEAGNSLSLSATPAPGCPAFGEDSVLRPEGESPTVELDATELAMLLSGVSLSSVKRRKRYARAG